MTTCAVTNFNNGLEASSDSDDEDKLHIVEEDSPHGPEVTEVAGTALPDSQDATLTVLPHNGSWNGVKEESVSEEEEDAVKDPLVEEILQQGDTAIIYPEAPEDEQSSPSPVENGGADENGTPDSFSQLHTCPYCSRGYKRNASLKEHIKYRHETSEDNYSCSHCSYTFTYRSQLERHMTHHRSGREPRPASQTTGGTGGNRKFKCTECSKAFKYKHHLKEHLRIHSGEKPYECSNCKKRFSHSGSYSSHISSKKCVGALNGLRTANKPPQPTTQARPPLVIAPARVVFKEKTDSKPLQEQLPFTQIKSEPVEYECKPVMTATATSAVSNGVANGGATVTSTPTLPQGVAMVVPTVGLMSPISINLNDLQNVLKVAMEGNVLRQVLGSANGVVTQGKQGLVVQQPQQQIISLPAFVDHDGTTKIIVNYSISPATTASTTTTTPTQHATLVVKSSSALPLTTVAATSPTAAKTTPPPSPEAADLTVVKTEPESVAITETEAQSATADATESAPTPKPKSTSACLLCEECPDNLEALHLLQHRKAANGDPVDSADLDPSFADLLSEVGVMVEEPPVDDLLPLLKSYFASNSNPNEIELSKISETVNIPMDVVKKWFLKMKSVKKSSATCPSRTVTKVVEIINSSSDDSFSQNEEEDGEGRNGSPEKASDAVDSAARGVNSNHLVIKTEPQDPDAPTSQAEPLDLSLPKDIAAALANKTVSPPTKALDQPLNLTCLRKDLESQTILVTSPQTGRPVKIVTAAQLPTLVAIAGQGSVNCLSAINSSTKRTILIPQLTYTYGDTPNSTSGTRTVFLNGHKEKRVESSSDGVSTAEEQNDTDSASMLKKRRMENGVYPCDICSKVFQKGSSLLRHKYEHTGKRPHECNICKKAFKHKHHLIEHSRLHSGEKPYQCDKCGKRFSHSGSYSQHMNHRYSYCKKDGVSPNSGLSLLTAPLDLGSPGTWPQSDSRTTTPPSQLDSDERESEEEDNEEAMCMDDIRVVQVDDGECEIYEGNFDDDDDDEEEEEGEHLVEEEMAAGEEIERERLEEEVVYNIVEVDDDHMGENGTEEIDDREEESASVEEGDMEEEDSESIREGPHGTQPTEEVTTDAK
ncbi:zinc finger E-box-binding homeobox 1-like isoform X2 [Gouania willdenowi]|uniref:Zinc finger E-box-binding homeobox 1-like n=1 Tax=Gouania willdenowi TaxID=441366 RepID=A0A8C5D9R3_GOUWI|nr:zinc finger E-box-binding homeobox 1-like isoform X2 [Gouania willdenowi]